MKNKSLIFYAISILVLIKAKAQCSDEIFYGEIHCVKIYWKYCPETQASMPNVYLRFVNSASTFRFVTFQINWMVGQEKLSFSKGQLVDANSEASNFDFLELKYSKMKNSAGIEIIKVENSDIGNLSLIDSCDFSTKVPVVENKPITPVVEQKLVKKWSDWYDWQKIDCFSGLQYRLRYMDMNGILVWQVEFINTYNESLEFSYTLGENWEKKTEQDADQVQKIGPYNSTEIAGKKWQTDTKQRRVENQKVKIWSLTKGNLKGYSDCNKVVPVVKSNPNNLYQKPQNVSNSYNAYKKPSEGQKGYKIQPRVTPKNKNENKEEEDENSNIVSKRNNDLHKALEKVNETLEELNNSQQFKNEALMKKIKNQNQSGVKCNCCGKTKCNCTCN